MMAAYEIILQTEQDLEVVPEAGPHAGGCLDALCIMEFSLALGWGDGEWTGGDPGSGSPNAEIATKEGCAAPMVID